MSRTAHKLLSASGGEDAYEIEQSVLLDREDSALLYRTPSSEGNRKTWTYSCWFKRTQHDSSDATSSYYYLFASSIYGGNESSINIQGDHIHVNAYDSGSTQMSLYSTGLFRDLAAWYHVVLAVDTTQGTASNRVKVYLNGSQITDWATETYPSQNFDTMINNTNWHAIGGYQATSGNGGLYRWDGLVAEAYLLDGTVKAATDFGETDSETGQWIPKKTAFTSSEYGTNGFYLKFASGAIGTDSSGEGNNYSLNSLGNGDILLDTPTNNFPIVNPLEPYNTTVSELRQGTLNIKGSAYSSGNYGNHFASFILPTSGKWYIEMLAGIQAGIGNISQLGVSKQGPTGLIIPNQSQNPSTFGSSTTMVMEISGDQAHLYDGGSAIDTDSGLTASSYVCAIAIDIDNNKFWGGYDGGSSITWMNSGDPANGSNGAAHTFDEDSGIYMAVSSSSDNSNRSYVIMNFGQNGTFSNYKTAGGNADGAGIGNFFYSPPSGFKALCTKNLPSVTIKKGKLHYNTVLYTGNDSTNNITGMGFQPDWVWLNNRSETANHQLHDVVSGTTLALTSDQNYAGSDMSANFTGFASDGFNLAGSANTHNDNGESYYAHGWKAGGATTTDVAESGSGTSRINQSSRSVNTTAGFSLIKYVGSNDEISNGQHTKVHHGLSSPPTTIWIKNLSDTDSWHVAGDWMMHSGTVHGFNDFTMALDTTGAYSGSYYMGTTDPDSTYIYLGNASQINDDGESFICYAWHEVEGFSSFGAYYGNGSTNGPFIYTGFKPQWVMFHRMNPSGNNHWMMFNDVLDPTNPATNGNWADYTAIGESHASYAWDFLSNGFKIRSTNASANTSGGYYMYMAFAKSPFKYSNAR